MPLTNAELARALSIRSKRINALRLFLVLQQHPQWWASAPELASRAGVPADAARRDLAELVSEGAVESKAGGDGRGNRALFRFAETDPSGSVSHAKTDPSGSVSRTKTDPSGSVYSTGTYARGHAPPDPDPKDLIRPSVLEGSGEGHARPEGERLSDVKRVARDWSVSPHIAHMLFAKLLGFGLTRAEAHEYLGAARLGRHPAFNGLERADRPLGAACTWERVEPWITWYRRPATPVATTRARREEPGSSRMNPRDAEAAAARVRKALG